MSEYTDLPKEAKRNKIEIRAGGRRCPERSRFTSARNDIHGPRYAVGEQKCIIRLSMFRAGAGSPYAPWESGIDSRFHHWRTKPSRFPIEAHPYVEDDCFRWLKHLPDNSIHAIVTDPPYGLVEYTPRELKKLRGCNGGVWRIPPSFGGNKRSPLPRFTTLSPEQLDNLKDFFTRWGRIVLTKIVPGANVVVASNPLLSHILSSALLDANLERRGEIIRLTMTMRGGDRPKNAHEEFLGVSVMPRSMWEPWVIYRKPIEGRIQDNLRKWKTGGFHRSGRRWMRCLRAGCFKPGGIGWAGGCPRLMRCWMICFAMWAGWSRKDRR